MSGSITPGIVISSRLVEPSCKWITRRDVAEEALDIGGSEGLTIYDLSMGEPRMMTVSFWFKGEILASS